MRYSNVVVATERVGPIVPIGETQERSVEHNAESEENESAPSNGQNEPLSTNTEVILTTNTAVSEQSSASKTRTNMFLIGIVGFLCSLLE